MLTHQQKVKQLTNMAESLVDPSADGAESFDALKWINSWIHRKQPCLGGYTPFEVMRTDPGFEEVKRVLGAVFSGAYL